MNMPHDWFLCKPTCINAWQAELKPNPEAEFSLATFSYCHILHRFVEVPVHHKNVELFHNQSYIFKVA